MSEYDSFNPDDKARFEHISEEIDRIKSEIPSDKEIKDVNNVLSKRTEIENVCSQSNDYIKNKASISKVESDISKIDGDPNRLPRSGTDNTSSVRLSVCCRNATAVTSERGNMVSFCWG